VPPDDEPLPEYRFDYGDGRLNRFAGIVRPGSRVVVLDPDAAEFVMTTEQVNALLRAVIATVPSSAIDRLLPPLGVRTGFASPARRPVLGDTLRLREVA